ncbi:hypothetical protein C8R44DRAFT_744637 [Mycena epipterygia]|nr:hypothetical protein C8R44DRAFT_744637 [Mycena epipterygia]
MELHAVGPTASGCTMQTFPQARGGPCILPWLGRTRGRSPARWLPQYAFRPASATRDRAAAANPPAGESSWNSDGQALTIDIVPRRARWRAEWSEEMSYVSADYRSAPSSVPDRVSYLPFAVLPLRLNLSHAATICRLLSMPFFIVLPVPPCVLISIWLVNFSSFATRSVTGVRLTERNNHVHAAIVRVDRALDIDAAQPFGTCGWRWRWSMARWTNLQLRLNPDMRWCSILRAIA